MDRPRITLYTQTGCAESVRTRAWLKQRNLSFLERNVSEDPSAAQALAATGIFATPLLVVGDRTVLGFRPDALEAALRASDIGR
jgi:arsenate reductase-like glutaredoxin family protein